MKNHLKNERGAVLVVGLVILVILSLLGITTMQTSTLEERMANNMAQRHIAFQAAESENPPDFAIAPAAVGADPNWDVAATWTSADAYVGGGNIDGVATQPRYIVEDIIRWDTAPIGETYTEFMHMFRITARGVGFDANTEVMLQTTHLLVP